ncbi:hypothetical protein N9350_01295 [Gammaproteobacteria bacterium]|nr:hypothetical protein [Gammaproteobacteria bacterium]
MANTTFTGPVISTNGFQGDTTGDVTGDVTGNVTGYIILPTSDPEVVGALWNNAGTITVSAG